MRENLFTTLLFKEFNPTSNKEVGSELLETIPESLRKELSLVTSSLPSISGFVIDPIPWLAAFHPSWLKPLFSPYPETLREKLIRLLVEKSEKASLFYRFLLFDLVKKNYPENYVPQELLPKSPLNPILSFSKEKKRLIVDLFGLHDLNHEIRKIVDKSRLNEIHKTLSRDEIGYLRKITNMRDRLKSPPLPLQSPVDSVKLKHQLHIRGLIRLKKAIADQDPMFIWHFARGLERSRGQALLAKDETAPPKEIVHHLQGELLSVIDYLKESSP